jgi:hypothetical protein
MIIKLQRPLASPRESDPPWYAYDRTRRFSAFIGEDQLPEWVKDAVEAKAYFLVARSRGTITFLRRTGEQPW